jgi:adenylate cyclase
VDIVGSMGLAATMDPEEWSALMERFFTIVRRGVNGFGGRVDKFTGDGAMALFGAPLAWEDHAQRGCAAALRLRDELADHGRRIEEERGITFRVRIGVNSGEVVAGAVGEDLSVEYTAVGNTVGLAQRVEAVAEPGTVCVTAATARLVEGYFELRDVGPRAVKGMAEPLPVFELVGPGPLRTALEVAAARGFSPFVGRDREMAVLEAALEQVTEGNGQVVGVIAGPGVGKSRLCHEFAERCRARGCEVSTGHGSAQARGVPFVPVLGILRAQLGIDDRDPPPTARAKVIEDFRRAGLGTDDAVPLLCDFLGIADPDRPAPTIDSEARQRHIFTALNRWRRARAVRTPVVIVMEDAHWLDPGTEAFVDNLIGSVPGTRQLVVLTFRPERPVPWSERPYYTQLALRPLDAEASDELARTLLGSHPSLDGVAELVRTRTGGNPLFIEQVVRALVEDGYLRGRTGSYELGMAIPEVRIPATVQAVVAARVDRLAEGDKAVLHAAAVIGRQFSRRLIGRVSGLDEDRLDAALQALVDGEFIHEVPTPSDEEYAFAHPLTEEVAYASQLNRRRAVTHGAVARALVELDDGKADERAPLVAHHHEQAGELLESLRWNARAARWAGFGHPVEAARHWRRVRALADRLSPAPEASDVGIAARLALLGLHWRLGAASEEGGLAFEDEAAAVFAEAESFARRARRRDVEVLALMHYGNVRQRGDAVEGGYALLQRAVDLADEAGDPGLRVAARVPLAWCLFVLGRIGEAAAMAADIAAIVGDDRSVGRSVTITSPFAWSRMQLAHFRGYVDRLDAGLSDLEEVVDIAGDEGDLETQAWAHRHCAVFAELAGADPEAAAAHARRALQWAEEAGGAWSRVFVREGMAISEVQRGRWPEAIEVVNEALAILRDRRLALADVPLLLAVRARAESGLGDVVSARSSAEEAVAVAARCGARHYEARARLELARAMTAGGSPVSIPAAGAELDAARAIADALGIRALLPEIHLGRAELAGAVGDAVRRVAELRTAERLFTEIGAPGRARAVPLPAAPG